MSLRIDKFYVKIVLRTAVVFRNSCGGLGRFKTLLRIYGEKIS